MHAYNNSLEDYGSNYLGLCHYQRGE
jgi:hypothetical protein